MEIIQGNILTNNTTSDYIIQQCNCLTVRSHGLSATLEKAYPYAKVYSTRRAIGNRNLAIPEDRDTVGTYKILSDPEGPHVVCLFGQHRPGKLNTPYFNNYPESNPPESAVSRLTWFKDALHSFVADLPDLEGDERYVLKFPYKIGCGLAGGNWNDYYKVLQDMCENYKDKCRVILYKYP